MLPTWRQQSRPLSFVSLRENQHILYYLAVIDHCDAEERKTFPRQQHATTRVCSREKVSYMLATTNYCILREINFRSTNTSREIPAAVICT